ncbi:two-component regulator propeller domain-containing protein [Flavobacterium sp.]|uniref:ligand-binding sensor domain-containing protein n=1 Tax=Flavobacterium sp. TaxID=239 RepID=UPI0038FCC6A4
MKNYIFLLLLTSFAFCNGQNNNISEQLSVLQKESNISVFNAATEIDNNIRSIFQDKNGIYWFGTNGAGVYRYDGKTLIQFTTKDGLSNNQVQSIQEDKSGNIWFGTGVFGVSRFDGQSFTTYTNKETLQLNNDSDKDWKIEPNDLWFYAGGGVYRYNDNLFNYLPLDKSNVNLMQSQSSPYNLSRHAVYSILKDKKGNVWFGTQAKGVCKYDGKSFTWFTEKGLEGPAVLGLFEDSDGNIWFGNNGGGLFKYDGKSLINFTEEKGLSNSEFKVSGKAGPGTLSRIYTICEDDFKNLWIGTVDAGVWKYDGRNFTNYTTKDGLTSNAINIIYKDKNGELWFGTDGDGICKFNGKDFAKFEIK